MVNMGNVWDRTAEFLSANARVLLPIALVAMALPNAINVLVGGATATLSPAIVQGYALVCALIALWGQLAVAALALDPNGGRSAAMARATGGFGRAVGAMLIVVAAILVLALPIVGVFVANGVDLAALRTSGMTQAALTRGTAMFVSLYALALMVVVIVVAIRLALLYPVIVAEGGVIGAIKRAWALSRGMVWKMIGVWLLFGVVYLVANAAITTAIGTVLGLFVDMASPFSVGRIIVAILSGLVTAAFTLIVAAFSAKLYLAAISPSQSVVAA